ncbi:MAG: PilT/PilU family type 4a pilus ATPase [Deltaproteobacteria bacterium]|nr:PilT/PilU family type 4a pilus ATPase [Deltaproteobacteria bacterium]
MASQTTPHADLVALVEEIATPQAQKALRVGSKVSFGYDFKGSPFSVTVEPKTGAWKVVLDVGPPPAASEEPATELLIERNQHEEAAPRKPISASPPGGRPVIPPLEVSDPPGFDTPPALGTAPPRVNADSTPISTNGHGSSADPTDVEPTSGEPKAIDKLLLKMVELGASDLHLSSGCPPMVRHHGEIKPLEEHAPSSPDELIALLYEVAPEKNQKEFEERHDTDFAHAIVGVSRFRVNMFRDRHGPGAVFRAIPFKILTPEQLGLPKGVLDLCYLTKGLVLVTGPTGSGKSTTLATLIDYVNRNRHDHLITIEDPIEFVHENKCCLVNQREVHSHTKSFKTALRAALREDPDIVLVGEMRDLETIEIAVETAETGHLVFGTLHTTTAPSTIDRIIDQFPPDRQEQIRQMLAESLRGVIAQVLCKKVGGGRLAAYEILLSNSAVTNLIRDKKTFQLFSLMQTARSQGMTTLSDSLIDLVKKGLVDGKEAYMKAANKAEFKNMLAKEGIKVNLVE